MAFYDIGTVTKSFIINQTKFEQPVVYVTVYCKEYIIIIKMFQVVAMPYK